MNLLRRFSWLFLLALTVTGRTAFATGIEGPTRWLAVGSEMPLQAPEFFFELETGRIARDLHTDFKARVPADHGGEHDYAKQTDNADLTDFDDAIKSGALHPPDVEKARAAHRAAIDALARTTEPSNAEAEATPALPQSSASPSTPTPTPTPATKPPDSAGDEFASEFADYHRGASAYHNGDKATAQKEWQALLNRPPNERKYRTSWAEYMLGKIALETDQADVARTQFHKLRDDVKSGAIDSLGLAVASIGWEGQLELKAQHFPDAARLYLEQRAAGEIMAVDSLHALMNEFIKAQPDLAPALSDPLLQRLTTAAELCQIGEMEGFSETNEPDRQSGSQQEGLADSKWLQLLEKAKAKEVKDADCVAWLKYQKGNYKAAERWLKLAEADSPYALWLKAKLALREGKVDAAAQFLSRAVPKLPKEKMLESRALEFETMPGDVSKGDLGAIQVGRADFLAAAKLFVDVRNCDDAIYLAEGVLTIPEVQKFIDELPEKPVATDEYSEPQDLRKEFREIIGRRLVRAGRFADARPYFADGEVQKTLDQYVELTKKGNDPHVPKPERAQALWKAATLIVDHNGHALFDYAQPAAMGARLAGREVKEADVAFSAGPISFGKPVAFVPPVRETEKKRLKSNIVPAVHRYHADYVGADLAWRAAQLMPDNDEHTAEVLNTAGSWLMKNDDKAADKFYQAIERRCSRTEIGEEAVKKHWFVDVPEHASSDSDVPEATPTP